MDKKQIYIELNKSSPGGFFLLMGKKGFYVTGRKNQKRALGAIFAGPRKKLELLRNGNFKTP